MYILTPLAILIVLGSKVLTKEVSFHVTKGNLIGRIKDLAKLQNLTFHEKRFLFMNTVLRDSDLRRKIQEESSKLGFLDWPHPTTNKFPCINFSMPGSGTNINNLTPGDINVIASIGDSLTAGLGIGASTILGLLWEDKGRVFDIGGIEDTQTLTNFLRVYNPDLVGFSLRKTFMRSEVDGFNVAVSGATSMDLMTQVETLIYQMKNSDSVDFEKDWKLINIFIGNNDICRSCEDDNAPFFTPSLFKERMMDALDRLYTGVPRAFVSLITMLGVYEVHYLNEGTFCSLLHLYECPCVAFTKDLENIVKVTAEFQNVVLEISNSGRYDDLDEFVVVTQPFFDDTNIPYVNGHPDLSYFAPDCFHLSERGHGQVALSLWNSLFEPIKTKKNHWHVGETFQCPSADRPYLATKQNSP